MPFAEGVSVHDGYLESPPVLGVQLVPYTSSDGEEVDSSDEEITVRQLADRERRRREVMAAADGSDAGESEDEEDDPAPPPPPGFEIVDWTVGDPVEHFLLYCTVGRSRRADWRIGKVVRVLRSHRQFTHDACLDGASQARGVSLTAMLYDSPEGRFWHKLSPVSA